MQLMLVALTLQAASCVHLRDTEWINFKAKYNKTYSSPAEESMRLEIFKSNLRRIEEHNAGEGLFRLGVNALADLCVTEYQSLLSLAVPTAGQDGSYFGPPPSFAGSSKDWRTEGAVTGVTDIGTSCRGASWAFAAAAAVESAWQIAGNRLVGLSEQQLIDCSRDYGTGSCESGLPQQAFEYLVHSAGLSSSIDYPYRQADWYQCGRLRPIATVSSWMRTTRGSEIELEYVVANVGPVTARVDANHTAFHLYSGGVYEHQSCSTSRLTLAVEIVGFGTETHGDRPLPYWLVKNAWGSGWGEYGYMKIRKDAENMCGIATDVTYPVV